MNNMHMNLESLANELLLDLFEYFKLNNLFNEFYNLNSRFNQLIFIHLQLHGHLNFQSISKTNFDIISQSYLPKNLNKIHSIHLSDDGETPSQINYFLYSYNFHFNQFINLQSLSLSFISSEQILNNLHQLSYLKYLKIDQCRIDHDIINNGSIFNQIWNLPNLISFYFQRKKYLWNPFFISPLTFSSSIKYLYLQGFSYTSEELHRLFLHTINLEYLKIDIEHNYNYQQISSPISSLKKLKIFVEYSLSITNNLLKYLPNLIDLTIELSYVVIDGNQWKEIIENNSPNLKKFQLKMEFYIQNNNFKEERAEQLINTFRNSFWMVQHQWYIQCHWSLGNLSSKGYLYTLPYYFKDFPIDFNMKFKSTYPDNQISWSYDNVENLSYIKNSCCSLIRFNNLKKLKIRFPLDELFWSIIPNLNRLVYLNVELTNDIHDHNHVVQFEEIIQRATSLYSLTLVGKFFDYKSLQNLSIRRLNLYDLGCFDQEQCENLINSSLGIQCEVLFINVIDRSNIFYLVKNMKNLRVLNIQSKDDQERKKDELINWLKDCLPNNWIIRRGNMQDFNYIQLWIR